MLPQPIIEKHSGAFEWGTHDCVNLCADMIEYMTGSRPQFPAYSTAREAEKILRGSTLGGMAENVLGEPVHPSQAQYGDIVLSAFIDRGQVLGIADPPVFWLKGESGLIPVEMNLAIKVFRCRRPQSPSS